MSFLICRRLIAVGVMFWVCQSFSAIAGDRMYGPWLSSRLGGGGYLQHASTCLHDPNRIVLATDVGGLYLSRDGGSTWRMLHGALPAGEACTQVREVVVHSERPDVLLAAVGSKWDGANGGIYRSVDAGKTFERVVSGKFEGNGDTRGDGFVMVRHPTRTDTVFAAPMDKGPMRSDDFGKSWRSLGLPDSAARDLVVDRRRPDDAIWLNADGKGLFRTDDGGKIWNRLTGAAEAPREMVQDPLDAGVLHGLFRAVPQLRYSSDGGKSWRAYEGLTLPKPGDARQDGTYAAISCGPDFVIVGAHGGVFYRYDCRQKRWKRLPAPSVYEGDWYASLSAPIERHFGSALGFVSVSPSSPDEWLFTDWYACYRSHDAGSSWQLSIDGIEMAVVHCVAQDPSNSKRIHAGLADIGYFRSDDVGRSFGNWGRMRGISNNIKHISVCRDRPDRLFAVGPQTWLWHANQVFRSDDGGDSWKCPAQRGLADLSDAKGARCNTVVVNPRNPDEVFLAVSGPIAKGKGGVYRSRDAGENWEWISEGMSGDSFFRTDIWVSGPELAVSADGSLVAMSYDHGRGFRRAPGAKSWVEIKMPGMCHCLAGDPLVPQTFYAAFREAGCWKSGDGGETWRKVSAEYASHVAVDMKNKNRLAVTGGPDVRVSSDGGETWRKMASGLPFRHARNVLCFAGENVVVGTGGSGVFIAPVSSANEVCK